MVFSDHIVNTYRNHGDYTTSTKLPSKYRPLIERGKPIANQTPRSEFPAKRNAGDTNLDLWLDGSIYPRNPATGVVPGFRDLRSLLCYVGDGEGGLLGYIKALQNADENGLRVAELADLLHRTENSRQLVVSELIHERDAFIASKTLLQHQYELHVAEIQTQAHNVSQQYEENIRRLQVDIAGHVQDKQRHLAEAAVEVELLVKRGAEEVDRLHSYYKSAIFDLNLALLTTKNDLAQTKLKCDRISKSPFYTTSSRKRKDLCDLSKTSGYARRRRAVIREMVQPATVSAVRTANFEGGTRKRLCGSPTKQPKTGALLASILSHGEAAALMENPKFKKVACEITNNHLQKMGEIVKPRHVLGGMDRSGISHRGYTELFKIMKEGLRFVDKNLSLKSMPNPFQVNQRPKYLLHYCPNSYHKNVCAPYMLCPNNLPHGKLNSFAGFTFANRNEWESEELHWRLYHINNSWQIPVKVGEDKKKRTAPTHLHLDKNNTLFVDVETVQRSMVNLYNITLEELDHGPLVFVLKMDEAEIVKQEKQERISITLMNRHMKNPGMSKKDPKYFSVQSEHNIWPIGTFAVVKESHECLDWVLSQTDIPSIIAAQGGGRKLDVGDRGSFSVEWHLACDMKTIKCLYGFSHGPSAQHSCIYCWCERSKSKNLTLIEAKDPTKGKKLWNGGVFSSSISMKPVRGPGGGPDGKGKWSPILDIPMTRVHFCTLHAQCRIVEKIIHLQIIYVWTIKDEEQRRLALAAMEHCLSKAGLGGGSIVLTRDAKLSGDNADLPTKLSFNGAKCRKLFRKSSWSRFDKVWKDVCEAERNNSNRGQSKQDRQTMWMAFDDIQIYFTSMHLNTKQRHDYKNKIEAWGKAYLKAFGEGAITHYIHVLIKLSSWFVSEYGSLAMWSTQTMEKSHYQCKTGFVKHTQYRGGVNRHSAIIQTFEWWYRMIQHREFDIEDQNTHDGVNTVAKALAQTRRQAQLNSNAREKHATWLASCTRDKSRWVPNLTRVEGTDEVVLDEA